MQRLPAEVAVDARADVGESPLWDPGNGTVRWVDIPGRSLHAWDILGGGHSTVSAPVMVGAIVLRAGGGLSAAAEGGFHRLDPEEGVLTLDAPADDTAGMRMNDGKVDPAGHFWAGSMATDAAAGKGTLWSLREGEAVAQLRGLTVPNGIDWSPDGSRMYYVDSITHRVDLFDFDAETGELRGRRTFARVEDGLPDGLAVDAEGGVWVAVWGGAVVRRFTPSGVIDTEVALPTPQVTSCAFGGPGLDELYITTAAEGRGPATDAEHAGALFCCRPGVTGQAPRLHAA